MAPMTAREYPKSTLKKPVMVLVLFWFLIFIAARTQFTTGMISATLVVNLFVAVNAVVLIFMLPRLTLKRELFVLMLVLFIYSIILVFRENLPAKNMFQLFLSVKYIFVYLAFRLVPLAHRRKYWIALTRIILFLFLASLPFVIIDYLAPNVVFPLAKDGRGIGGISTGSLFASRVIYSEFLVFVLILMITIPVGEHKTYFPFLRATRPIVMITILVVLFLTYSRKEMLIGLVILIIDYGRAVRLRPKWLNKVIIGSILFVAVLVFFFAYRSLFLENLNENYVRFKILVAAWDIFTDRFPFGTGPGTFGTGMSKSYTAVYEEFRVPAAVTGYNGKFDGAIFDLFFISFFAEYGLGAFILFALFLHPFRTPATHQFEDIIDVDRFRLYLIFLVFGVGFFVPILGNLVGLISFMFLGLLADKPKPSEFCG